MKAPYLLILFTLLLLATAVRAQTALEIEIVVPAVANTTMPDEDGDYPAYIVLKANTMFSVSGNFLTDDAAIPGKWQVPDGYNLVDGETMVIFASGKDRKPPGPDRELHTNFIYECSVPFCGLNSAQGTLDTFSDRTDRCVCDGLTLVRPGAKVDYLIPNQSIGSSWTLPSFTPGKPPWQSGATGVGYDAGENPLCDGLILYATMDTADISGTIVKDVSGPTVHDGTMTDPMPANTQAVVGQGLEFNCEPVPRVDFGSHAELSPPGGADFSGAIWVKSSFAPTSGQVQMVVSNEGFNNPGWSIYRTNINLGATSIRTVVQFETAAGDSYRALLPLMQNGVWHHIAFVVDGGSASPTLQGYFDGVAVAPVAIPSGEDFSSTGNLLLGSDGALQFGYCGEADDFALWGRALTASEVSDLYDAGNQGLSFKDPAAGVGGSLYDPLIATDVELEMKGVNSSAYVRVPFYLSAFPGSANKMLLRMRYDDGFQAYLNGVPVASRRIPSILNWNSKALSDRFDPLGLVRETIDISSHIGALQQGVNVLAIHGLNADANADRFLVLPELCVELRPPGGGPNDPCVKTTNGTEFWLAFPENFEEEPGYPPEPSVCVTGARGTSFTVDMPKLGIGGYPKNFVIPSGQGPIGCVVVHLPKEVELEGADDIEDKAVVVKANANVSVYGQNRIDYSTDRYLGLPLSCLGTEYMVLTYKNVQTDVPLIQGTQLAIVAPYDATQVTVTLKDGTVLNVPLDSGETYQFRDDDPSPVDVTGARVKANKPIGVYGSHRCANIQSPSQFFCDFLVEQLFPLAAWGHNYRIAPLETRAGDTLRILAAFDNTPITIDEVGAAAFNVNLNAGDVHEMTLDAATSVSSDLPISVAQFSNSWDFDQVAGDLADPFMVLIQPDDQWLTDYYICAPPSSEIDKSYVTVIAKSQSDLINTVVRVNGAIVAVVPSTGTFDTGEYYGRLELPPSTEGCYHIDGRGPIALTVYGFDVFDSYGYPGGLCLPDLEPPLVANPIDTTVTTTGTVSVPNVIDLSNFADNVSAVTSLTLSQSPSTNTQVGPGTHIITIQAVDELGNTALSQMTLFVEAPNSPPQLLTLAPQSKMVNAPERTIDITLGFSDAEQASADLDYQIVTVLGDTHAFDLIAVDNTSKELRIRCKLNLMGSVDIRLRATDAGGLSAVNSQLFDITGTPFQQWLNQTFPPEVLSNPNQQVVQWGEGADGDADGNPTLGEAYHGRNPNVSDDIPLNTVTFDKATGEYVFAWSRSVSGQGTEADCNWSMNLTAWYLSGEGPPNDIRVIDVTPGPVQGDEQPFEARIQGAADQRIFFRLLYRRVNP